VIFQPAEEGGKGGLAMVEDGLMDRWGIDEVYALHNAPGVPPGQFVIRPGPMLAAADGFSITLTGKGGHAAKPDATIDPIVMSAQVINALQTIISRNTDPVQQGVLTVTSLESSSKAFNVIPEQVFLKGTVRAHSEEVRAMIERRLSEIVNLTAAACGGTAEVNYEKGVPVTVNAPEQTEFAAKVARDVSGGCGEAPLIMGGEDFSFMLNARPGAFIMLGNGDSVGLHHPEYNFNDDIIPAGCSWFAELIEQRMKAA